MLFKNKYRIKSVRLSNWDHSRLGYYFVTVCTYNREEYFGDINNGTMCLNQYGSIVFQEIYQTSIIRKNVIVDKFVIMPNHIHLILIIDDKFDNLRIFVETQCIASLSGKQNKYKNKFGPQKIIYHQ